jgi:hypothetical protein
MPEEQTFCSKCGNPISPGSAFCNKCGTPVGFRAQPTQPTTPMPMEDRYEKHEKHEKGEKAEKHEKGRGGSIAGSITGGLVLIWLGFTFYLAVTGRVGWENWWALFLIGLGAIIIFQGFVMYAEGRRAYPGPFIGGAVLFVIGLTFYSGFMAADLWPLFLVAIGVVVLASAAFGRRRVPSP